MKCTSPEDLYCKGTSPGILNSFTHRDMPVTERESPQQQLRQFHRRDSTSIAAFLVVDHEKSKSCKVLKKRTNQC